MACKCYHAERNFIGKIGVCWGTRECDACSCGGDESKCDFYDDVRKRATTEPLKVEHLNTLKPCPFCGYPEQSAELFNMPFKGRGWAVACPDCGAMSHLSIDRETAERRWNARSDGRQITY